MSKVVFPILCVPGGLIIIQNSNLHQVRVPEIEEGEPSEPPTAVPQQQPDAANTEQQVPSSSERMLFSLLTNSESRFSRPVFPVVYCNSLVTKSVPILDSRIIFN